VGVQTGDERLGNQAWPSDVEAAVIRYRMLGGAAAAAVSMMVMTGPAFACGGLVAPNGTVHLLRTTTLAAYHDGVEHYITSFTFIGAGGAFGSIVPLPAVPTSVERAGSWTLQRLERETTPVDNDAVGKFEAAASTAGAPAQELLNTTIDALDITVLKGGGPAVGLWARQHGFTLTPDAPEMLDYYASRSPIFLAARFDGALVKAKSQTVGDGTPIDITMPLDNPWVPLRILTLGRAPQDTIQADVYLLTDHTPALLPAPADDNGTSVFVSEPATTSLLDDLRGDRNMGWIPSSSWLTEVKIATPAFTLQHDLAVDTTGKRHPSPIRAGLIGANRDDAPVVPPFVPVNTDQGDPGYHWVPWAILGGFVGLAGVLIAAADLIDRRRRPAWRR
jgi:hypothetical protein